MGDIVSITNLNGDTLRTTEVRNLTTPLVLAEVLGERVGQDEKWGQQDHPDFIDPDEAYPGEGAEVISNAARHFKDVNDQAVKDGTLDWSLILLEEVYEAVDEAAKADTYALREELLQVAAVAVAWVEAIDRRLTSEAGEDALRVEQAVAA